MTSRHIVRHADNRRTKTHEEADPSHPATATRHPYTRGMRMSQKKARWRTALHCGKFAAQRAEIVMMAAPSGALSACAAAAAGYGLLLLFRQREAKVEVPARGEPDVPDDYTLEDSSSAAQCLADAFFDDPVARVLMPDDAVYRREAPFLNGQVLWALHSSYEMCEVIRTPQGKAVVVSLWEPASMTVAGGLRFMWIFVSLLRRLGLRAVLKIGGLALTLEAKRHKYDPQAYHLQMLGTHPEHQGRGLGGKVIEVGIARAAAAGRSAYLESSNPKNVPFYKRHGFQVLEEYYPFANGDDKGPVMTLMLRPMKAD